MLEKSSFMNKITRANVEVQPYAFTTKSLFEGHTDYRFLTWQVIDTPGILDGPLEERNTKEMQSITALAHLKAAILYFIDISEQCGYSIEKQVDLFNSIKPLFTGKPLVIVLNKIDIRKPEDLPEDQKQLIENLRVSENVTLVPMSNISEEGIAQVKQMACDLLLVQRTELKINTNKVDDILSRVHLAMPVPRDSVERLPHIPDTVDMDINDKAHKRNEEWKFQMRLYKDMDPDYKGMNWKDDYVLDDDEWKNDPRPEMMDGKNVYDYWENNNEEKLESLEREEAARLRSLQELYQEEDVSRYKLTPEQQEKVKRIREKRKLMILDSRKRRAIDKPKIPKKYNTKNITVTDLEAHLESLGMDPTFAAERLRSLSVSRDRSGSRVGRVRERALSEERALSKTPLPGEGYRNVRQRIHAEELSRKNQKLYTRDGRMGEADRHIYTLKPKHLFSGKRTNGKTDRR